MVQMEAVMEQSLGGRAGNRNRGDDSDFGGNIYPIDYSIHYVDIVEKWKIYYCIDRSVYDVQWRL